MTGLSVFTTIFQLAWGASCAVVAFGIHFVASKYFEGKRRFARRFLLGGVLLAAAAVIISWPYQNLEHSPQQDNDRTSLFLFCFFSISVLCLWYRWMVKRAFLAKEREEAAVRKALRHEREEYILAQKAAFFAKGDWPAKSECLSRNQKAKIMLSPARDLFRIVAYRDDNDFAVISDVTISVDDIFAIEAKSPEVVEKYLRTELVPIITSKNKSVVGRAIIGDLLAGPLGAVVGGMSGAKADISTRIEERKVADERIRRGAPVLIVGTTHPEHPIFKFAFHSEDMTEQWEFRLKAAKADR